MTLADKLLARATSYRLSGPSAEHTAALLEEAALVLTTAEPERDKALAELDRLRKLCTHDDDDICHTLGKALGYPWYKDDQSNFPGATEENGVCVGEHVAASIAAEAAKRLDALAAERDELLREKERLGAGWLPIETAPKDGTKIRLAWSPDDWTTAEGLYRDGEWFAAPLFYRDGKSKPGIMYLEFREHRVTPTYWMPLSPPPVGSGRNLADAHSKSPAPSSQSERIAVLEAALRKKDEALKPFAAVAEHDIGDDEADSDRFRPMYHNRAPLLTVGDLRRARAALSTAKERGDG